MTDSQLFRDLFHDHDFKGATQELRIVRGGYALIEARQRLGHRIFSGRALDLNEARHWRPTMERTEYPLLTLIFARAHILDAHEVFKTWMRVVPVAGIPEDCCGRTPRGDLCVGVYVYGPFHKAARTYWQKLVKEFRDR